MKLCALALAAGIGLSGSPALAQLTSFDLSTYSRVAAYDLPVGTGANQLAAEASAVTYNWDRNTLFVMGDEGTGIVELSLTGGLLGSMTLTGFADTEGLTYVGNSQFVVAEERIRTIDLLTYSAGTTLNVGATRRVDLGANIGNIGNEGLSWDPLSGGFVVVKEKDPQGVFLTVADFAAGTASNGSASTVQPLDLFNPALLGLADLADVFALSNLPSLSGSTLETTLLFVSHESGELVHSDRLGNVFGRLSIGPVPADPTTVGQNHEGVTMDRDGNIYIVNEGGGPNGGPQLWVYSPVPIPEPATGLLWAAGLAAVAWRRRAAPQRRA